MERDLKRLLCRMVAAQEAPYRPVRQAASQIAAFHAARQNGVSAALGGGRARERKATQRQRDDLSRQDLLLDGKPTQAGRKLVRSWVWPYLRPELIEAVNRLHARTVADDCRVDGWVPEPFIAGVAWGGSSQPFGMLQQLLLPLLTDRVIESNCTVPGHCFYRLLKPIDEAIYQIGEAVPASADDWDADHCRAYEHEYDRVVALLLNDHESRADLGWIPLPASGETVSRRHPDDLSGIEPMFAAELAEGKV
jgi:hypothetical protein